MPLQSVSTEVQAATQLPLEQTEPTPHGAPQAPQFALSVRTLTQAAPQCCWPGPQHRPVSQTSPVTQMSAPGEPAHAPQFAGSELTLVHVVPLHEMVPAPQHLPALQDSPLPHGMPQPPQFAVSVVVLVQLAPQCVGVVPPQHRPLSHVWFGLGVVVSQTTPLADFPILGYGK